MVDNPIVQKVRSLYLFYLVKIATVSKDRKSLSNFLRRSLQSYEYVQYV